MRMTMSGVDRNSIINMCAIIESVLKTANDVSSENFIDEFGVHSDLIFGVRFLVSVVAMAMPRRHNVGRYLASKRRPI